MLWSIFHFTYGQISDLGCHSFLDTSRRHEILGSQHEIKDNSGDVVEPVLDSVHSVLFVTAEEPQAFKGG